MKPLRPPPDLVRRGAQAGLGCQAQAPLARGKDAPARTRVHTLRWPSPVNGESSSTARISCSSCPSAIAPSGLDRPSDLSQPSDNAVVGSRPRRWSGKCDGPALESAARRSMASDVRPVFPVPPGIFRTDGRPLRVNSWRPAPPGEGDRRSGTLSDIRGTDLAPPAPPCRSLVAGPVCRTASPSQVDSLENGEGGGTTSSIQQDGASSAWRWPSYGIGTRPRSPRAPTP